MLKFWAFLKILDGNFMEVETVYCLDTFHLTFKWKLQ